ncbi:unnamed protein product [Symbiodinium microadriaticum]|nr:unnamed protein product [Symbiodinium microadriaticum]
MSSVQKGHVVKAILRTHDWLPAHCRPNWVLGDKDCCGYLCLEVDELATVSYVGRDNEDERGWLYGSHNNCEGWLHSAAVVPLTFPEPPDLDRLSRRLARLLRYPDSRIEKTEDGWASMDQVKKLMPHPEWIEHVVAGSNKDGIARFEFNETRQLIRAATRSAFNTAVVKTTHPTIPNTAIANVAECLREYRTLEQFACISTIANKQTIPILTCPGCGTERQSCGDHELDSFTTAPFRLGGSELGLQTRNWTAVSSKQRLMAVEGSSCELMKRKDSGPSRMPQMPSTMALLLFRNADRLHTGETLFVKRWPPAGGLKELLQLAGEATKPVVAPARALYDVMLKPVMSLDEVQPGGTYLVKGLEAFDPPKLLFNHQPAQGPSLRTLARAKQAVAGDRDMVEQFSQVPSLASQKTRASLDREPLPTVQSPPWLSQEGMPEVEPRKGQWQVDDFLQHKLSWSCQGPLHRHYLWDQWGREGPTGLASRSMAPMAEQLETWQDTEGKDRQRALLGQILLPSRYNKVSTMGPGQALMMGVATKPLNTVMYGPDCPEDSRHRVLVTKTAPPILLLELNAVATFNMMDPDTSQDIVFGMDAVNQLMKSPKALNGRPLAYVIQGSGPHFCPGGNPNPKLYPGHIPLTVNQYAGYLPFIRCREMALPGICALHGSLVGGGVAYSLNNPVRFADSKASACFGNLSRGAVPGMVLSSNIPQALGLHGALDIYLTDNTYSTYACVKAGYLHGVQGSIAGVKQEALKQARRLGQAPFGQRIVGIKPELDVERFGLEAWAIDLGARTEGVFRNVGAKSPKEMEAEAKAKEREAKLAAEGGTKQEDSFGTIAKHSRREAERLEILMRVWQC